MYFKTYFRWNYMGICDKKIVISMTVIWSRHTVILFCETGLYLIVSLKTSQLSIQWIYKAINGSLLYPKHLFSTKFHDCRYCILLYFFLNLIFKLLVFAAYISWWYVYINVAYWTNMTSMILRFEFLWYIRRVSVPIHLGIVLLAYCKNKYILAFLVC